MVARIPIRSPRPRRRPAAVRSGVALACGGVFLWACGPASSGPAGKRGGRLGAPIRCAEPEVDFGTIPEGSLLNHFFALEVGDRPARILETKTDCGCTVTRVLAEGREVVPEAEFAPRTPLMLAVEVNTRGKRGRTPRKIHLRVAEAGASAPEAVPLVLTVHADVQPWLVAEPSTLDLIVTPEGEPVETSFLVRRADGEGFGLRASRKGLPPWVTVRVDPGMGAGDSPHRTEPVGGSGSRAPREHRVTVRFDETAPRGTRGYSVLLESDVRNENGPLGEEGEPPFFSLHKPVAIEVRGPVGIAPPSLSFGVVRPAQIVSRSVRIESHDPEFVLPEPQAKLVAVGRDGPFLLPEYATLRTRRAEHGAWEIEVTLAEFDGRIQGNFFARLVVSTGHPELPELEASLMGVATQGRASVPGGAR